jgi:hypothetical protein
MQDVGHEYGDNQRLDHGVDGPDKQAQQNQADGSYYGSGKGTPLVGHLNFQIPPLNNFCRQAYPIF